MIEWSGWSKGEWVKASQLGLSLQDWGHLQGAVIVERLRTVGGRLLDLELHLDRFFDGCVSLGISLQYEMVENLARECMRHNQPAAEDFSLVLLATPGSLGGEEPTLMVYAQSIAWRRLQDLFSRGEHLVIDGTRNVSSTSWSPQLKTRARLHYYLSDKYARSNVEEGIASGLLLDQQGSINETSSANVIVVSGQELVCPPMEYVLHGISLERTLRLARQMGIAIHHRPISPEEASEDDEDVAGKN